MDIPQEEMDKRLHPSLVYQEHCKSQYMSILYIYNNFIEYNKPIIHYVKGL